VTPDDILDHQAVDFGGIQMRISIAKAGTRQITNDLCEFQSLAEPLLRCHPSQNLDVGLAVLTGFGHARPWILVSEYQLLRGSATCVSPK
jgi:hypothetical protein